jgi:hypothetical protein
MPTAVVGLSDDSITMLWFSKHFSGSDEGAPGRRRAMMPPEAACVEASVADPGRPPLFRPRPQAVSTGAAGWYCGTVAKEPEFYDKLIGGLLKDARQIVLGPPGQTTAPGS